MTNGFDKLLRESLAAEAVDGQGAECPDAAVVAGWFDGTLSHAERTAVETHAASCARCQATIAALVRTDRPAPRTWWRAPAVQWLVPVAVAAGASLIIWVGVLRTDDDAVRPAAPSVQQESSARAAEVGPGTGAREAAPAGGRAGTADVPAKPASLADADAREKAEERLQRARVSAATTVTANAAKAATPPAEAQKRQDGAKPLPQAPEPARRSDASSPAPAAMAGAAATQPPAPVAPRSEQVSATSREGETFTPAQTLDRAFLQSAAAAAGRAGRAPLIQSPDRSVLWRITDQSQVERSADGGLTWQAQTTRVNAVLVAGVAPSSTVCWLVGWRGVVLKTTDGGQTWTRVAFPEEINLVGVVADDDRVATVTAAGGRQLHTSDGGGSWK